VDRNKFIKYFFLDFLNFVNVSQVAYVFLTLLSANKFKNLQKLENFNFSKDFDKFSDSIGKISTLCFEYYEIWDGTMEPMSKSKFYCLVNKYYLQLKNFK